jgi:hypothetical protein
VTKGVFWVSWAGGKQCPSLQVVHMTADWLWPPSRVLQPPVLCDLQQQAKLCTCAPASRPLLSAGGCMGCSTHFPSLFWALSPSAEPALFGSFCNQEPAGNTCNMCSRGLCCGDAGSVPATWAHSLSQMAWHAQMVAGAAAAVPAERRLNCLQSHRQLVPVMVFAAWEALGGAVGAKIAACTSACCHMPAVRVHGRWRQSQP